MHLLDDHAAPDLPRLRDAGEQVPVAAEHGYPGDIFEVAEPFRDPGRAAGLRLDVDVARVRNDRRRLRTSEARDADPVRRHDRGGRRRDHPGQVVDLGEHDRRDGGEIWTFGVHEEVPSADDHDAATDALFAGEAVQHVGDLARFRAQVDVGVHGSRA
jgi:hypothetical protein